MFEGLRRQLRLRAAYRDVFATPAGELVLHDLLRRAGILSTSVVLGSPEATHVNEGRRQLALEILQQLRWSEGDLAKLAAQREHFSPDDEE